ncbi:MAG: 3'-5' exonuclease [Sediminibacterium sp.]|nr:3'-5' exonuclease [Sediminibacterium sp.]
MSAAQLQNILFIDIETVPLVYTYKDLSVSQKSLWDAKWTYRPDADPEQHYKKAGIYAEFAKVICIGLGFYDGKTFRIKALSADKEEDILQSFHTLVSKHFNTKSHLLCAHNGKEFDFPFLCRRFIINNIPLPKILQIQGFKPWDVKHLDTLELWKFGDLKNYTSLNLLASILHIPSPKEELDGSQVSRVYYEEKNPDKIISYCLKDVVTLARVYQRLMGHGHLSDENIVYV